jgi:hypothetical protein
MAGLMLFMIHSFHFYRISSNDSSEEATTAPFSTSSISLASHAPIRLALQRGLLTASCVNLRGESVSGPSNRAPGRIRE